MNPGLCPSICCFLALGPAGNDCCLLVSLNDRKIVLCSSAGPLVTVAFCSGVPATEQRDKLLYSVASLPQTLLELSLPNCRLRRE